MKRILPIGAGSEPECIDIEDATEAVGDCGDVDACYPSPNGQHEFRSIDGHRRCIHCREIIE